MNISGLLDKLMRRETLSIDEASSAMGAMMSGEATNMSPQTIAAGVNHFGISCCPAEAGLYTRCPAEARRYVRRS